MNINEIKNIITENTLLRRQTQTLCPHEGQEARWLVQGIAGRSVRFFLEAGVLTTEGCDGKDGKVWTSTHGEHTPTLILESHFSGLVAWLFP